MSKKAYTNSNSINMSSDFLVYAPLTSSLGSLSLGGTSCHEVDEVEAKNLLILYDAVGTLADSVGADGDGATMYRWVFKRK